MALRRRLSGTLPFRATDILNKFYANPERLSSKILNFLGILAIGAAG